MRALNKVLTPVTTENGTDASVLTKVSRSRGFTMRTLRAPSMKKPRQFAVRAKM